MSVKFDLNAANELINNIKMYCEDMQRDVDDLLDRNNDNSRWNDNQRKAFDNNINELAKDLKQALKLEFEYMQIFEDRIKELRG